MKIQARCAYNKMAQIELKKLISGIIIVLAIFSGSIISWEFSKDYIILYQDGVILAKEKWIVESERTYFNLDSWYDNNVKCPKILELGGHTTPTRCYYPENYFEALRRSLINTKIEITQELPLLVVTKKSPNYMYGTRGAYAGYLTEEMFFDEGVEREADFPVDYFVNWDPRDTRNYRVIWRLENLKDVEMGDGTYTNCQYNFGLVKIDLKDACKNLDKVILENGKANFYFNKQRGKQNFNIEFVDPIKVDPIKEVLETTKNITEDYHIYEKTTVTVPRELINYKDVVKEYVCNGTIYFNDDFMASCLIPSVWNENNQTWTQKIIFEVNSYSARINNINVTNDTIYWIELEEDGTYIHFENTTTIKEIGFAYNGKKIEYDNRYKCKTDSKEFCCWECNDGDCVSEFEFDYIESRCIGGNIGGWNCECFDLNNFQSIDSIKLEKDNEILIKG